MKKTKASLIIALDHHSNPLLTIPAIINQTTKDFETIIVNGGSNKKWAAALKKLNPARYNIRFFDIGKSSRAAAWNFGSKKAQSPIIIFMGDDFRPSPDFITSHLAAQNKFKSLNTVVIGPAVFGDAIKISRFMHWAEDSGRLFGVPFKSPQQIPKDFFWGANCSMKKDFFRRSKGFDESFPYHAWDDYELGLRLKAAGMKMHFEPKALAQHDHKVTLRSRAKAMRQAGESAVIFEKKYPGSWPWQEIASISRFTYQKSIFSNATMYLFTRKIEYLHNFYIAIEDFTFSRGYKNAL